MLHDLSKKALSINTGYYWVSYPEHPNSYTNGKILYHRLVMENLLNRYLDSDELVHHKDENRLNNDPSNLELSNRRDHAKHHHTKFDIEPYVLESTIRSNPTVQYKALAQHFNMSATTFYSKTSKFRTGRKGRCQYNARVLVCGGCRRMFQSRKRNAKYCSPQCSQISQHKVERPSAEELSKLIWEIPTTLIAKRYEVSDKAVEKWCKKLEIPKPPRGYWAKQKVK